MLNRPSYSGRTQRLVLAYDVGTTFSGASYCILDPGQVPVVTTVTRYPALGQAGRNAKIPTILYYDKLGYVRAAGAETLSDKIQAEARQKKWTKAEWFKLHLRPKLTSSAGVTEDIPPLPQGKTAVQVFGDFLRYLHKCSRKYIEETYITGSNLWQNLEPTTEYILSHPNGWEGGQQALMRQAAIMAGLIPDTENGRSRVSFVTEGEASLHFCIHNGLTTESNQGIVVVDAGGGTIDISAYKRTSPISQSFEEIAPSQTAFKGSIFVTRNARRYFIKILKGSKFEEDIPFITEAFDQKTKLSFANAEDVHFIKFGRLNDNAPERNIKDGQLKLQGSDVAKFFEPSVTTITSVVEDQCRIAKSEISSVFLVGGFGSSEWLYNSLKKNLAPRGLKVCVPDGQTNKAVSDGAISYHIDHLVSVRIAKYFWGVRAAVPYTSSNHEHAIRDHRKYINLAGRAMIPGHFSVILSKNTNISETQEFRQHYYRLAEKKQDLNTIRVPIMCFRGARKYPRWFDEEENMYSTLCHIEADLSDVPKYAEPSGLCGMNYYQVDFDVVLSLGLTEDRAAIAWQENGVERRSSAQLIYDPNALVDDIP